MFDLLDIDKKILNQLSAIGRLDEDSSGMIILTDDGKINHKIAHPKSEIKKTYEIKLEKSVNKEDIKKIEEGIVIDLEKNWKHQDYKTKPCEINKISDKTLQITLIEGKKREVKRIFESLGNKVLKLKRISIAKLNLDDLNLKKGEYVFISKNIINNFIL